MPIIPLLNTEHPTLAGPSIAPARLTRLQKTLLGRRGQQYLAAANNQMKTKAGFTEHLSDPMEERSLMHGFDGQFSSKAD